MDNTTRQRQISSVDNNSHAEQNNTSSNAPKETHITEEHLEMRIIHIIREIIARNIVLILSLSLPLLLITVVFLNRESPNNTDALRKTMETRLEMFEKEYNSQIRDSKYSVEVLKQTIQNRLKLLEEEYINKIRKLENNIEALETRLKGFEHEIDKQLRYFEHNTRVLKEAVERVSGNILYRFFDTITSVFSRKDNKFLN